ncbi:MAG: CRISPR-associated helicase Cas3' [Methanocorpusculum sp.]|nr:CRISPR-associated helicase Cas3' [Methanocorpusculum sp.]
MHLARKDPESGRTQTLAEHSRSVAGLCRTYGEKIGCPDMAELCGLLHDMGKAKKEFQDYLIQGDISLRGKINHSAAGAQYIIETFGQTNDPYRKTAAQIISLVIVSHHSGIIDCLSVDGEDTFSKRVLPENDICYEECKANFLSEVCSAKAIEKLFSGAAAEVKRIIERYKGQIESRFHLGLLVRYFLSCVVDADRFDSYCFAEILPAKDTDYHLETAWDTLLSNLEQKISGFSEETPIDKERKKISDACKTSAEKNGGIHRLSVPTGGGKTLSSLRYALAHAKKYHKSHIIYAIPYTSIIDQNAEVIKNTLKNEDLILEHHSNLIREKETYEQLGRHALLTERWDIPVVLTTNVQLLNTLFLGKNTSVRRMHNLAESIIIFDEVQTIPLKTLSMFNTALNYLAEICGATIILCTATQPALETTAKPVRISDPAELVPDTAELFQSFKRVEIRDSRKDGGYSSAELAAFLLQNRVGNTLCIMNTKTAAEKLYRELEPCKNECRLYYLSTNLCPAHRKKILAEVIQRLNNTDKPVLCITTQLIEAGVDVSFDTVIRSLAGLDSIAQAAGRCNRHGRQKTGTVHIINSSEEKLGTLPDILSGQIQTERLLREYKENPEYFGNDLLSPKAISSYYNYYFHEGKNKMDYPVSEKSTEFPKNTNLYELLQTNRNGCNAAQNKNIAFRYPLRQAFAAAGREFQVIEEDSISVIVPYEKGKELIEKIRDTTSLSELKLLLRAAQQYSINLFNNESKLESYGVYQIGETGIFALSEFNYSEEYGFSPKMNDMPCLII